MTFNEATRVGGHWHGVSSVISDQINQRCNRSRQTQDSILSPRLQHPPSPGPWRSQGQRSLPPVHLPVCRPGLRVSAMWPPAARPLLIPLSKHTEALGRRFKRLYLLAFRTTLQSTAGWRLYIPCMFDIAPQSPAIPQQSPLQPSCIRRQIRWKKKHCLTQYRRSVADL